MFRKAAKDERIHLRDRHGLGCNADLYAPDADLLSTTDPDDFNCEQCYGTMTHQTLIKLKGFQELLKVWPL